jgi:hypothetical protein
MHSVSTQWARPYSPYGSRYPRQPPREGYGQTSVRNGAQLDRVLAYSRGDSSVRSQQISDDIVLIRFPDLLLPVSTLDCKQVLD